MDGQKPCPHPWHAFLPLSWVTGPDPFPSFSPGRFEGICLRDMREGEREGLLDSRNYLDKSSVGSVDPRAQEPLAWAWAHSSLF